MAGGGRLFADQTTRAVGDYLHVGHGITPPAHAGG
jgi:hypothetical protein